VEGEFVVTRLIYLYDILKELPPVFWEVTEALIRRPVQRPGNGRARQRTLRRAVRRTSGPRP